MAKKLKQYQSLLINRRPSQSLLSAANIEGFTAKGLFEAHWKDPFIQKLIQEGYIGYKYKTGMTNWLVGNTQE